MHSSYFFGTIVKTGKLEENFNLVKFPNFPIQNFKMHYDRIFKTNQDTDCH